MARTVRTRTLATGALLAGVAGLVGAAFAAPAGAATPTQSAALPPDTGSLGQCSAGAGRDTLVPTGAVANDRFTQAFREFGNGGGGWSDHGGWAASDGVYSADVPGHGVVWLMNDTFLGPVNADESMTSPGFIHGSAVLGGRDGLPDTTVTQGTHDAPESLVSPPGSDGDPWYWNGDGIVDGGKLLLFEGRTGSTDGPPPWNFGWLGSDIATLSTRDLSVEKITPTYGTPGGVEWGNELVRCGGYIYVYGQLSGDMYVARAHVGHLAEKHWQFFDGTGWSQDELSAASIGNDVGASYSVTPMDGQFVLTTTANAIFTDHKIYVATSDSPTGPFVNRTAVYTAPEGVGHIYAPYNVAAHPTISKPGELVVSYNVNSQVGDDLLANANNNRPRFVTITFDRVPRG
ncbi:hypothetical protein [Luteimicrobium sp. DT211]|uniref:hypothetical protein n=1 Tax=Luteimicrobium sp. DT211 TaxID=3393412 RepID=UPI003CF2130D